MNSLVSVVLFAYFLGSTHAVFHKFHSGECPQVDSMPNFDMNQFLGEWYVIENSNDNLADCIREEFTVSQNTARELYDMARNELENTEPTIVEDDSISKEYQVKRSYLPANGGQFVFETGKVKFLSNQSKSEMEIGYPYTETGMLNLKHYQVIATDYDNYALVWRCQRTIFGHRRSAQIISRYQVMEKKTFEELKTMMKLFEVQNDIKFRSVKQTDCKESPMAVEDSVSSSDEKDQKKKVPSVVSVTGKPDETKGVPSGDKPTKTILSGNSKNKKKLISIDVGGFHLSLSFPFW